MSDQPSNDTPALYMRDYCQFCAMVQHTITQLGVDVELRNIWDDDSAADELIEATGKEVVPVLRYQDQQGNTVWLPESRDIISWFKQHYQAS